MVIVPTGIVAMVMFALATVNYGDISKSSVAMVTYALATEKLW